MWPDPTAWRAAVAASRLVASGERAREVAEGRIDAPFVLDGDFVQTGRMARYEDRLARGLRARAAYLPPEAVDVARLRHDLVELFTPLPEPGKPPPQYRVTKQVLAAAMTVLSRTTIVSGGPGTGKTTTIRKVLVALFEQARAQGRPPPRVALAAPTGKAAARMRDSLASGGRAASRGIAQDAWDWLTALQPRTIQKLLVWQPRSPSRFRHGRDAPLPFDVVVIDEASMIAVSLMCKLVEAIGEDARLVLLGDRNQLVSVEAGSALADITTGTGRAGIRLPPAAVQRLEEVLGAGEARAYADASAPPLTAGMVHFTEAFRFEEEALRIPIYALADASAAAPRSPAETAALDLATRTLIDSGAPVVRHLPHDGDALPAALLQEIVEAYRAVLAPMRYGASEATRAQVLAGIDALRVLTGHRKGALGVTGLNVAIGNALQEALDLPERMRGSQWWTGRLVLVTENDYEHGLWNGDIGVVYRDGGRIEVVFPPVEREQPTRAVAASSMPAHETAFAMTIHKSQGSQFQHAYVILPSVKTRILTRELVYTGISRAQRRLTVCGDPTVLREGLDQRVTRATSLETRLWGGP